MQLRSLLDRQHGLLTFTQARAGGRDPREITRAIRSGAWIVVRRGVYVERGLWDELDEWVGRPKLRVHAAAVSLSLRGPFSHDSAAVFHGLGLPGTPQWIHLSRHDQRGTLIKHGIKHHGAKFAEDQVTTVDGLRMLDPARTAVDMTREHGFAPGLAAMDRYLSLGHDRADLARAVAGVRGWPHSRRVGLALELADPRSESWLESLGRAFLHELGFADIDLQFGISDGHQAAFADMRVGRHLFEVDGAVKYRSREAGGLSLDPVDTVRREKRRTDFLTGFKLGMSRLTAIDLNSGRAAAERRVLREYADTVSRYGSDISDLSPYLITRRRPVG